MIPSFMIWKSLGWYNTLNPLWVPAWLGSGVLHLPDGAAHEDHPARAGRSRAHRRAERVQTWYYIILPQVKPAAAAIAIMTFMGAWNEFMGPLIYLRDQSQIPAEPRPVQHARR